MAGPEQRWRAAVRSAGVPALVFAGAAVAASVGLGLALPHLSKEGAGTVGVLGAVLLGLGAVVAVRSARRLLGGTRRRWWALTIPFLLVTAYLSAWSGGQGVAASLPAHPALGSRTPAGLGLAYEDVTLRTSDGVALAGWWLPAHNGAAVAVLHGAGSTRTAALDQAAVLARAGYGVLLVDARGHGESEGTGMDLGWWGERDTAAAVAGLLTAAPEPVELRASIRSAAGRGTRFLLVAAGDVETEELAAQRLRAAAPDLVEVWTMPGAGHVQGLRTDPEGWSQRVVGFFDDALPASR